MSEFTPKKLPPPRFALSGHKWMPIAWRNFKDEIRVAGEWRLVSEIKFVPTAEYAKQNLKRSPQINVFSQKIPLPKNDLDTIKMTKTMGHLADVVERGLAEHQSAKKPTHKLPKYLREEPSVDMEEIRDAAALLHYLVNFGCKRLMEIAKKNPEILRPIARKTESWPLMMSLHAGYGTKHITFLESLQQGKDALYDIDKTSRNGTQRKTIQKGTRQIAEKLYCCLLSEWRQTKGALAGNLIGQFCDNKEISNAWWKIAESRLLEAYPEPHKIPELERIAAPGRKYPSDKKADILRRLKVAFLGLAKNQAELQRLATDSGV